MVREEQAEDLVADFSWELEEGEGHCDCRSRSNRSGWRSAVQLRRGGNE